VRFGKIGLCIASLIEIAARTVDQPVSAEELARLQDIPHGFLRHPGRPSARGRRLEPRGQSGSWKMQRPPDEVTIADVIRAVDGPLVSVHGVRPESVTYKDSAVMLQPGLDRRQEQSA
jgi:DNA-binding IscR family transcriptional regulator